jgi:hypothetical protein
MVGVAHGLRSRTLNLLPDVLLAGALLLITSVARVRMVPFVSVSPDSVDPLLRAFQIGHGGSWLPPGHGPQFGPALYWLQLPLVTGVDGLRGAFERMLAGQALTALAVYLAVRLAWGGAGGRGIGAWPPRLGAIAAALAVSTAHGPRLALAHTYETYQAPELVALATLATVVALVGARRVGWLAAAVLTPLALMVHPFTVCIVPGLLLVGLHVYRREGARSVAVAGALAAVVSLPGLVQLGRTVLRADRGLAELAAVARSASAPAADGSGALTGVVGTFLHPELPPLGPLLLVAPALALGAAGLAFWRTRQRVVRARLWLTAWIGLTQLSLLGVAMAIGYLRPYHGRILLAPGAVALGMLVTWAAGAVFRRIAVLWPLEPPAAVRTVVDLAAVAVLVTVAVVAADRAADRWSDRLPADDDLAVHGRLAATVSRDSGDATRWVEVVSLGGPRSAWGYGPALVLDQRLAGEPADRYSTDGSLFLLVHGPDGLAQRAAAVAAEHGLSPHPRGAGDGAPALLLPRLGSPAAAREFTAALCRAVPGARARGDAHEYLTATDDDPERWFDGCLLGERD